MAEFDDLRNDLRRVRQQIADAAAAIASQREHLKQIAAQERALARVDSSHNEAHAAERERLRRERAAAEARAKEAMAERVQALEAHGAVLGRFVRFTDPREGVQRLDDRTPILLMPVRLETRFKSLEEGTAAPREELWVRVYPDDCWIDSFDPTLTDTEVVNARTYWTSIWQAGGIEEQDRAAWAALVGSHGSGRAAWIVEQFQPANLAEKPTKPRNIDVILSIALDQALPANEAAAVAAYWRTVWLADGDRAQTETAAAALEAAVGPSRAAELAATTQPVNFASRLAEGVTKDLVTVDAAFVVFPQVETKQSAWSSAPKMTILPDRFVFIGYDGGETPTVAVGNPVPSPLIAGPDPSAPKEDQLHEDDAGNLVVPDDLKWMSDFDRAVQVGMGFRIPLTSVQARAGFRRVLVIGVRLSADSAAGKGELETLILHHAWTRKGFSIVPQGTPTNNTEALSSGHGREDDANASFDDRRAPLFSPTTDWLDKRDGQWLAEYLGIDAPVLEHVHNAGATDQRAARAMNRALWPATLGYWMETMMSPVFTTDAIAKTRRFFCDYVVGAGAIPALRFGDQPYGLLPACATTRMRWLDQRGLGGEGNVADGDLLPYLQRLYSLLTTIESDWQAKLADVPFVGKPGDPHALLLDIVGLHSGSVEWSQRYAEDLKTVYNRLNLQGFGGMIQAIILAAARQQSRALLNGLGYTGQADPFILQKIFSGRHNLLKGGVVDDRPLSETELIRSYTPDGRNYLQWLIDAASTSLDALYKQDGFTGDRPPAALLYLLLRHALQLSYDDVSIGLHLDAGLITADQALLAKIDNSILHVVQAQTPSESRYQRLYAVESAITGSATQTVGDFIGSRLLTIVDARNLREQIDAIERLKQEPTGRLERSFADHVDCCAYRLDAWQLGLLNFQLALMRNIRRQSDDAATATGLYLGAFGWLEDVLPENKILTPVTLTDPDLIADFGGAPLMKDSTNQGYVHAPSLNHAVAAAVLRNGYVSDASAANRQSMAVNLTSERVRTALGFLQGIRAGQSLSDLLGYQFERGLHDSHNLAEVDKFIYKLRKAFPLRADRMQSTRTEEGVSIEAIEARNVIDGLALVEHVKRTNDTQYPFGKTTLPSATAAEAAAINAEVGRVLEAHDAVADLALAEGVYQAVVGNYDRVASTYDAYARGQFPPEPDVIRTPFEGVGLTHRVALHLRAGADHLASPLAGIAMTPRAQGEPAINDWLARVLPPPEDVGCMVSFRRATSGLTETRQVTLRQLDLQPADLVALVRDDDEQAMSELDDRMVRFAVENFAPRPDQRIVIEYMQVDTAPVSAFELIPLIRAARRLTTRSRALRPSDLTLMNEASSAQDAPLAARKPRLDAVRSAMDALKNDIALVVADIQAPLADLENRRDEILDEVDDYIASLVPLVARAALFVVPQAGWGFAYDFRRATYAAILQQAADVVARWDAKLAEFDGLIAQYAALPGDATDDERFSLLTQAERAVSTAATSPLPASHAAFRTTLETIKKPAFVAKRDQFALLQASTRTDVSDLLADFAALLPVSAFDYQEISLTAHGDAMVRFAQDAVAVLTHVQGELQRRLDLSQTLFDEHDGTAAAPDKLSALERAAKALLGDDFVIVPEFDLSPDQGDELENALAASVSGSLFTHLTNPPDPAVAPVDFPVDTWFYGVARVREKMRAWEQLTVTAESLRDPAPDLDLRPLQLPFVPDDRWLGLEFRAATPLDNDRLLYTAHFAVAFNKAVSQCGLLLDDWTEIIPGASAETGITFHHDRPNTEAPQVMLLVTPAEFRGSWQWNDIVDALHSTLELAKRRALEPKHIDQLSYAPYLPATTMAVQVAQLTIAANLAINNQVVLQLQQA